MKLIIIVIMVAVICCVVLTSSEKQSSVEIACQVQYLGFQSIMLRQSLYIDFKVMLFEESLYDRVRFKQSFEYYQSHSFHKDIFFRGIVSIERRQARYYFPILSTIEKMQGSNLWNKAFLVTIAGQNSLKGSV